MATNSEFLIPARADLAAAREEWLKSLKTMRRLSDNTLIAYERDTRQFLQFLTGHLGEPPSLKEIGNLRIADLRSFLANRRNDGAGARTLGRGLAGVRSLLRHLEKRGLVNAAGASAMRAPRQPKSLPKPLTADDARRVVSADGQMAEEPWIAARNAAVLTLLYGCGLRISEALGLSGDALSDPSARSMTITGKGSKTRLVPLLPAVHKAVAQYRALCPFDLSAGQPLFRGAKGGPLHAAIIQREMQKLRAGLGLPDSATPMPCATLLQRIFWGAEAICAPFRSFWAMQACPPHRSIPASIRSDCWKSTTRRIPAPEIHKVWLSRACKTRL